MSWNLDGSYYFACSCTVGCPCSLGEMETTGSVGCSGVMVFATDNGEVDGVDVSRTFAVLAVDWPAGFTGGNGVGRLYFDEKISERQRGGLEAVLRGQRGGVFELVSKLITRLLPTKLSTIESEINAEESRIKVGDLGAVVVRPLRGTNGEPTRLINGGASFFRGDVTLAKGQGSRWEDPELRQWEGQGYAELSAFQWAG